MIYSRFAFWDDWEGGFCPPVFIDIAAAIEIGLCKQFGVNGFDFCFAVDQNNFQRRGDSVGIGRGKFECHAEQYGKVQKRGKNQCSKQMIRLLAVVYAYCYRWLYVARD